MLRILYRRAGLGAEGREAVITIGALMLILACFVGVYWIGQMDGCVGLCWSCRLEEWRAARRAAERKEGK